MKTYILDCNGQIAIFEERSSLCLLDSRTVNAKG